MSEFQRGLQAFERLIKSDDGVRAGSCRKCGGGGHLTFECRNTIKLDEPMSKPKTSSRFGFLRSKLGTTKAETLLPGSAPASSETGATVRTQSGKPSFKRRDSSRKKSTPGSSRAKEKYDSADDATSSSSKSMSSGSESDSGDDRRRQNRGRKSRRGSSSRRHRSSERRSRSDHRRSSRRRGRDSRSRSPERARSKTRSSNRSRKSLRRSRSPSKRC